VPGIRVASLYDPLPQNAHTLAKQFPSARLAADPQELLSHPEVEAVAILTPPATHFELARMALRSGKHVLVEKPLALEEAHAEELVQLAHRTGLTAAVGFHLRNHRLVQRARAMLRAQRIGRVRIAHALWCARMRPSLTAKSWRDNPAEGGTLLDDVGIHHVDLLRYLLEAEVRDVRATVSDQGPSGRHVRLALSTEAGAALDITVVEGRFEWQELELVGERGRIALSLYDAWGFDAITDGQPVFGLGARLRRSTNTLLGIPEGLFAQLGGGDLAACYAEQWRRFADAVIAGTEPVAGFDDGLAALRIVRRAHHEDLLRSARLESSQEILLRPAITVESSGERMAVAAEVYAPPDPGAGPPLSVILSSPDDFQCLRTTLRYLAAQTVRDQIELVLVAPETNDFEVDARLVEGFYDVRVVRIPRVHTIAQANAAGVRAARGRVIALAEDHCFPSPTWAAALLEAHRAPHAVVGPVVGNANPATWISWADFLAGYGPWMAGAEPQCVPFLPGHNSSYKREVLWDLGDGLEEALEAETVFHMRLAREGCSLFLEPRALVHHVNFALLGSWTDAQFLNGRMFAALRSREWSIAKRLLYFAASPAIPLVRILRALPTWKRLPVATAMKVKVLFAIVLGMAIDGYGQMFGYAAGPGSAREHLARLEFHRFRHIPHQERDALFV
jgi:predicted dehydrogenase